MSAQLQKIIADNSELIQEKSKKSDQDELGKRIDALLWEVDTLQKNIAETKEMCRRWGDERKREGELLIGLEDWQFGARQIKVDFQLLSFLVAFLRATLWLFGLVAGCRVSCLRAYLLTYLLCTNCGPCHVLFVLETYYFPFSAAEFAKLLDSSDDDQN